MAGVRTLDRPERATGQRRATRSAVGNAGFVCVVGAPRCGTTSLAGFLQGHPDVCFSQMKEPHYFSQRDLSAVPNGELERIVRDEYLDRYFPERREGALLAEGSVSYLYAPERMAPILRLWPDARFVVAVRDPLEMLPSLHQRLLYNGDETVADFEAAWRLMPERLQGRHIPRSCVDPRLLQYEEIGRLGAHVERFFQAVGRERCFVSVFDDLRSDPRSHYRRLMEFLELPPAPEADLVRRRGSAGYRIAWLQRFLKRPPIATQVLAGEKFRRRMRPPGARANDSSLVRAVAAGRKRVLAWNRAPPPPVRLSAELRGEICERLSGEVRRLSDVIGRDLSHWLDGRG